MIKDFIQYSSKTHEVMPKVGKAKSSLPYDGTTEKYRVLVHLFYYEDYSVKEISKILDRKESTIKPNFIEPGSF